MLESWGIVFWDIAQVLAGQLGYAQNFWSKNFGPKERAYSSYGAILRLNQLSRAISGYYHFSL
jgi:hypothetical protein